MRRMSVAVALLMVSVSLVAAQPEVEASPSSPAVERAEIVSRRGPDRVPDFNGDGYADLVVKGMHYGPGASWPYWVVTVIYGSGRGLNSSRHQIWEGSSFPEGADRLVAAETAGDFDGDGYDDLALGTYPAPAEGQQVGGVRVLYGSAGGLRRSRSQYWTAVSAGLPAVEEPEDVSFGRSLVAADFGGSGHDDLAIGAPQRPGGGAVTVVYGSGSGLTARGSQVWSQASPGIPGTPDTYDNFGHALAAGRFTGGPHADLAVGVPGDGGPGTEPGPGAVNVIYGSAGGLSVRGSALWSQGSRGVKGVAVAGEGFGSTLAAGHFRGRAAEDLAIGAPADTEARAYGGAVNVLAGSRYGLSAKGDQLWTPRSRGLAGKKHLDNFFGTGLAVGSFGRDQGSRRFDDLAITAWTDLDLEAQGIGGWMGAVEVIYGGASGLSAEDSQIWRWRSPGVKGNPPREQDGFGHSGLSAGNYGNGVGRGRGFDELAVSDSLFPAARNAWGAVSVLPGSRSGVTARGDQLWTIKKLHRSSPRFFAR